MKFYVAFTVKNGMVVEADSKKAARAAFEESRADALEVLSETIKEDNLEITGIRLIHESPSPMEAVEENL